MPRCLAFPSYGATTSTAISLPVWLWITAAILGLALVILYFA